MSNIVPARALFNPSVEDRTAGIKAAALSKNSSDTTASAEPASFGAFIKGVFDIINPLQHLPIIGSIYREITGDKISPVARLAGDTLYGGAIGCAFSAACLAYDGITENNAKAAINGTKVVESYRIASAEQRTASSSVNMLA